MHLKARYRVTLWESERGWGRKPFQDLDCETLAEAEAKVTEVNGANTTPQAPDYYIFAHAPELVDADRNPPRDY